MRQDAKKKRPRDVNQLAHAIIGEITGEKLAPEKKAPDQAKTQPDTPDTDRERRAAESEQVKLGL